jgi:hypothetical protein
MQAGVVLAPLALVAHTAVNESELFGVLALEVLGEVDVATDTSGVLVRRAHEYPRVDVHGDLATVPPAGQVGVIVTIQALVVGLGPHGQGH